MTDFTHNPINSMFIMPLPYLFHLYITSVVDTAL